LVDRYGIEEVAQWYFEVWNEPNCGFWNATIPEYWHLMQVSVEAIHSVDARLRVGGPATCQSGYIAETFAFAQQNNVKLDFISTHEYPTDPMDDESKRRTLFPDIMNQVVKEAQGLPVFYTEYNSGLFPDPNTDGFPNHDISYAASFVTKYIKDCYGIVDIMSYWEVSDVFEEGGMDARPFHNGFGMNTVINVPKPAYRMFEILHNIGTVRLDVQASRLGSGNPNTTVESYAVRSDRSVSVFVYNWDFFPYELDTEQATVTVCNLPNTIKATVQKIDNENTNPRKLWEDMGAPTYPTKDQIQQLQDAAECPEQAIQYTKDGQGCVNFSLTLPPYAVNAIKIMF